MNNASTEIDRLGMKMDQMSEKGLEAALKAGAQEAKISTSSSFSKKLVVENKEFTLANSIEVQNYKISVHKDKKKGTASINTNDERAFSRAIEEATHLAEFSVADDALNFPSDKEAPPASKLNFLYDQELANFTIDELQEVMKEVLANLTKDKRIAIDRFEMSVDTSRHGLFNSLGVSQSEIQTTVDWTWMGMAVDGKEVTGFDYDYNFSFSKENFREKALKEAEEYCKRLISFLKPRSCPSYRGPVLLSPRAVQSIIVQNTLYNVSGRSVMDGKSKWQERIDKKVIDENINISDNPHSYLYSGATSFDTDGLPTAPISIIEKGVLKTHLCDCYSARKLKTKSTATAGGPFGLTVQNGNDTLQDLFKSRKELLVVDRFSGNSDPIKGSFSGVAKSSRLYVDGKDSGGVKETMIAGDFYQLLDNILGVSSESQLIHGTFESPWILVDGVSVTGE